MSGDRPSGEGPARLGRRAFLGSAALGSAAIGAATLAARTPDEPQGPGILGPEGRTDGLAVTLSVGASLFDDRFGLAERRPRELVRMPFLSNDRLDPPRATATCSWPSSATSGA
jgi:deferrochelatase/peroxidase EfeB